MVAIVSTAAAAAAFFKGESGSILSVSKLREVNLQHSCDLTHVTAYYVF